MPLNGACRHRLRRIVSRKALRLVFDQTFGLIDPLSLFGVKKRKGGKRKHTHQGRRLGFLPNRCPAVLGNFRPARTRTSLCSDMRAFPRNFPPLLGALEGTRCAPNPASCLVDVVACSVRSVAKSRARGALGATSRSTRRSGAGHGGPATPSHLGRRAGQEGPRPPVARTTWMVGRARETWTSRADAHGHLETHRRFPRRRDH